MKVLVQNRRAWHDWQILDQLEAGVVLTGREIKAVRANKAQLTGSYIKAIGREAFWVGGVIQAGQGEQRTRKILLHRKEIDVLKGKTEAKGFSVVPLRLYLRGNLAKLQIALAQHKKKWDRREEIKKKDIARELSRSNVDH